MPYVILEIALIQLLWIQSSEQACPTCLSSSGQRCLRKSPAWLAVQAGSCPLTTNSFFYLVHTTLLSACNRAKGVTCSFYSKYASEHGPLSKL